jgi:hypothetical protein
MAWVLSLLVASLTGGTTLAVVIASGGTSGGENIVIVSLTTLVLSSAAAFLTMRRLGSAILTGALSTFIVVGAGWAVLYAFFDFLCGLDPSAC